MALAIATGCFCCVKESYCDTILLKNGRVINGIVKNETENEVTVELGFGKMSFLRSEISGIKRSSPEEAASLNDKCFNSFRI